MEKYKIILIKPFLKALGCQSQDAGYFTGFEEIILNACQKVTANNVRTPNPERGLILYHLIKHFDLMSYIEIGTSKGYSCICAALGFQSPKEAQRIVSIDIDSAKQEIALKNILRHLDWQKKIIKLVCSQSDTFLKSYQEQFDIIFIDGSHTKEDLLNDATWAFKNINKFILFDDYNEKMWPEVFETCNQIMEKQTEGTWWLILSDRLLYLPEKKQTSNALSNGHGILLYDRLNLLSEC